MIVPTRVKFVVNKKSKPLYEVGLTKGKSYNTSFWDDELVKEIFEETRTVTVIDDHGTGHEIEYGDYEIIKAKDIEEIIAG